MTHNADIPSGRIRFALEALKEAEASDFIEAHMDWFRDYSDDDKKCLSCLGGIALLKSKGVDLISGSIFEVRAIDRAYSDVTQFEESLDCFRTGDVSCAFIDMGLESKIGQDFNRDIADYHENPVEFYTEMNKLADDLEKAGY